VGVATLQARGPTQTAISVEDPYDLLMSPYRNAVLVVSGFGDDIYAMGYDPQAKVPFSPPARLDYAGEPPAVPARGVVITRGSRAGLTLVAENVGIRQVRFFESGEVVDLGLFAFSTTGEDLTAVTSAIGIAP